jgi:2-desacetyl-2-hydroxyethyl bacteriochlorophyllide A dehydrogenase
MVQAVFAGPKQLRFEEKPIPEVGPLEILIETILSGVSVGTEMAVYRGAISNLTTGRWGYWNDYPIPIGYELVGYARKIGSEIKDVKEGDRIIGLAPHGSHGLLNPLRFTVIPDSVTNEEATLTVLGSTTTHGVRRARITYGDRVLVLGLGKVGLLAALHLRRAGAHRVYLGDPSPRRREFARNLGFVDIVDPLEEHFEEHILDLSGGLGVDVVVEASGHPSSIAPAFQAAKTGGRVLILGNHTQPVQIVFSDYVMHKELTIIGTWRIGNLLDVDPQYNRWNARTNLDDVMELIREGKLPVKDFVTHRFHFRELPDVYRQIESGSIEPIQVILSYE